MTKYTGESLTTYEPRRTMGGDAAELSSVACPHQQRAHPSQSRTVAMGFARIRRAGCRQCTMYMEPTDCIFIRRQAIGLAPFTATNCPTDAVSCRSTATGCGMPRGALCGTAIGQRPHLLAIGWQIVMAPTRSPPPAYSRPLTRAARLPRKLIRRFGITEGNRQTLLLGMRVSQLVNPYQMHHLSWIL